MSSGSSSSSKIIISCRWSSTLTSLLLIYVLIATSSSLICAEFFDSNGRLTQVEYADRASMKGGTIIGACSDRAAVILTWSPVPKNSLPIRKIHRISKMCGVSSSGIVSDVQFVTNKLFEDSLDHVQLFGSETPAIRAATNIANYVHERTLSVRYRPLGIRMCIASYDETSKGSILEIDAMGNLNKCKVACIGPHADKLLSKWQAKVPSTVDAVDESSQWGSAELIEATLDVLRSCVEDSEDGVKVETGDISVAYVAHSTPFAIIEHGDEVLAAAMARRDFSPLRQRCLGQQPHPQPQPQQPQQEQEQQQQSDMSS